MTPPAVSSSESHTRPKLSPWHRLLAPFSLTYWFLISLRNSLYNAGVFQVKKLPKPVIAVGNITTGGTGKTPLTHAIVKHLSSRGGKPAILSRGYKSQAEKSGLIFRAAHDEPPTVEQGGDEISMLARKLPGIWFGVGADRIRSASRLTAVGEINSFVMDDAFQHRAVHRDLNIVVIDATNPFGNGMLLPAGTLREPLSELKRADVIVLSRCEAATDGELTILENRLKKFSKAPVIRARTVVTAVRRFSADAADSSDLGHGSKVWALAAIANPEGFRRTIQSAAYEVAGESWFADHHRYDAAQIGKVVQDALSNGAAAVVTTEKDAVKLSPAQFRQLPCFVFEIGIDFGEQADIFWGIIDEVAQC